MIIGILYSISILGACVDRDRINPIDPQNPDTHGKLPGVKIFSVKDTVFLSWDLINLKDINGYRIYRKSNLETNFMPIALVPSTVNTFKDTNVNFGVEYSYQVSAVGPTFESERSDEITIRPGPTFNWVGDNFGRQIIKLTHDAQHEIFRVSGFITPFDIESNTITNEVWVINLISSFTGEVIKVSPDGKKKNPIIPFTMPFDMALDMRSGSIWVADTHDDLVVKLDSTGDALFSINSFSNPVSVSVDQRTGDCWVADNQLELISKIEFDGSQIENSHVNFNAVQSLIVNSSDGSVWVADSSRAIKLDQKGELALELAERFKYAFKIAINENTGEIWVLNLMSQFNKSTVSKFTPQGQKLFEIDGFTVPEDLSINLYDNSCLVADTQNDRIVRVSAEGDISSIFALVGNPQAVSVQNEF
ncbi:MAG: hypothetical protein ACE5JB_09295 [bacterium]